MAGISSHSQDSNSPAQSPDRLPILDQLILTELDPPCDEQTKSGPTLHTDGGEGCIPLERTLTLQLPDADGQTVLMRPKPWSPCLKTPVEESTIQSQVSPDWSLHNSRYRHPHEWSPEGNYFSSVPWSGFGARPKDNSSSKVCRDEDGLKTRANCDLSDYFPKERFENWRKAGEALKMALTQSQNEEVSKTDLGHKEFTQADFHKTRTSLANRALEIVRKRQHLTPELLWPAHNTSETHSDSDKPLSNHIQQSSHATHKVDAQSSLPQQPVMLTARSCRCGHPTVNSNKTDSIRCTYCFTHSNTSSSSCSSESDDVRDQIHRKPHRKKKHIEKSQLTCVNLDRLTPDEESNISNLHVPNNISDMSITSGIESIHLNSSNPSLHGSDIHRTNDYTPHIYYRNNSDCAIHASISNMSQEQGSETADSGACSDDESGVEGECWQEVSGQLTERLYCFKVGRVINRRTDDGETTGVGDYDKILMTDFDVPSLVSSSSSEGSIAHSHCCCSSDCSDGDLPALKVLPDDVKYPSGEESAQSLPDLVSGNDSAKDSPSSTSSNEAYADDEFECDCIHCLENNRQYNASWMNDDSYSHESEELGQINDMFPWHFSDYDPRLIDLSAMFQAVILQMLSVHPDLLDQAPPPAPPDVVNNLPTKTIDQAQIAAEMCCPICLCPYELSETVLELPCHHQLHPLCIKAWLVKSGTCPVCRFILGG